MLLHQKLNHLLKPYKYTEIARTAGLSFPTIHNILTRKRAPTLDTIKKLCDAMGVDVGWFIDDSKGWPPVRVQPKADRELQTVAASAA